MSNRRIVEDGEWYPVYSLIKPYRSGYRREEEIEVSDELLARHARIMQEFDQLQAELKALLGLREGGV